MKKLLHIIATPRQEESRTLQVSEAFLEVFKQKHASYQHPDVEFRHPLYVKALY